MIDDYWWDLIVAVGGDGLGEKEEIGEGKNGGDWDWGNFEGVLV